MLYDLGTQLGKRKWARHEQGKGLWCPPLGAAVAVWSGEASRSGASEKRPKKQGKGCVQTKHTLALAVHQHCLLPHSPSLAPHGSYLLCHLVGSPSLLCLHTPVSGWFTQTRVLQSKHKCLPPGTHLHTLVYKPRCWKPWPNINDFCIKLPNTEGSSFL